MSEENKILDGEFIPNWNKEIRYKYASTWKRLANFLVDLIFVCCIFFIVNLIYDLIIGSSYYGRKSNIYVYLVLYFAYYSFAEFYFSGITLGKALTKTKVITINNSIPKLQKIVIRSFARLIPLDHLSFLFGEENDSHDYSIGWHDKISETRVIDLELPISKKD